MARPPRRLSLALTAVLAVCLAAPAFAQVGEAASFTFRGPVNAVDAAKKTITIGGATGGTFEVDPNVTLLSGSKTLEIGDIKPGWFGDGNLRGAMNPKQVITYLEEVDEGEGKRFLASVRFG